MISTWIWRFSRGSMIYGWSLWIITLIDQGWNWLKLWTKFPRAYEVTFNGSIVDAVSKSIRHKFAINTTNIVNMGTWFKFIGSSLIGKKEMTLPLKVVCICRFLLIAMMVKRFPIVPFLRFKLIWFTEIHFILTRWNIFSFLVK